MRLFLLYYMWILVTHFTCEYKMDHEISMFDVIANIMFLWSLKKCVASTPSRTPSKDHFCSILRVDIGKHNHKSFILVCLYGTVGNCLASYRRIADVRSQHHRLDLFRVNLISMYFVSTCVAFGGSFFLLFHIILLCQGVRSSTVCRKIFGKSRSRSSPVRAKIEYNFYDVFENAWWFWLIPN